MGTADWVVVSGVIFGAVLAWMWALSSLVWVFGLEGGVVISTIILLIANARS